MVKPINTKSLQDTREQYRKVQGLVGEQSFSIVLPKIYAINLGIGKGDFVKVTLGLNKIIIEKAETKKEIYTYNSNIPYKENNKSVELCDIKNSIRLTYQTQIDVILDNPDETHHIIPISVSHLRIFECNSRTDFDDIVLKPLIQKAAIKRNLEYENALDVIFSRIAWESNINNEF